MSIFRKNMSRAREIYSWADTLVFATAFVIILFTFIFRTATVEGPSMIPTLLDREQLVISNMLFTPAAGDIVVIDSDVSESHSIVKRVIATEGQTVDVNANTGEVKVDGKVLTEEYILEPLTVAGDQTYPLIVPKGKIFVMGDNRNVSLDSRYLEVGCIDTRYVLGRILLRVAPLNRFGTVK